MKYAGGSYITLFSPSDVTACVSQNEEWGRGCYNNNLVFTEWRHCFSQNCWKNLSRSSNKPTFSEYIGEDLLVQYSSLTYCLCGIGTRNDKNVLRKRILSVWCSGSNIYKWSSKDSYNLNNILGSLEGTLEYTMTIQPLYNPCRVLLGLHGNRPILFRV